MIQSEILLELAEALLVRGGADPNAARLVAESLVGADLRGVDSHGVMRIPGYLEQIDDGTIQPRARPQIVRETRATVVVDGNRGFGQLAARTASLAALEKVREQGIVAATVAGVAHVGRLGEFAELAAEAHCIGLVFVNCGQPGGLVAPFGGRSRLLGTNPLAFGIPAGTKPPIVADFSTASATDGRVRLLLEAKKQLPEGWILDAQGEPSIQPGDLYRGGSLLPAAGHKGFGLGLLVEILGGVLAGAGCSSTGDDPGNGYVIIVIDPSLFVPGSAFGSKVDRVIESVEAAVPAPGVDRVLVPGTPERETEARRRASGIPLASETWKRLEEEARRRAIDLSAFNYQ